MQPQNLSNRIWACFAEIEECERKLKYLSSSIKDPEIIHGFYELPIIDRGITFQLPKSKTGEIIKNIPILLALLILEFTIAEKESELLELQEFIEANVFQPIIKKEWPLKTMNSNLTS